MKISREKMLKSVEDEIKTIQGSMRYDYAKKDVRYYEGMLRILSNLRFRLSLMEKDDYWVEQ